MAKEPEIGYLDIVISIAQEPWVLPIVHDFLITGGVDASFKFMSYVMNKLGGRPIEAHKHLESLVELNRDHLASRDRDADKWRQTFVEIVEKLAPAAKQAVLPIGKGAHVLRLAGPEPGQISEIDEPMADAIRSKENDEVGDMEIMTIKVDGITHDNRQLKIVHPTIENKFLTAEVRDPNFDNFPNVYTDAASNLGELKVQAKPMYRAGELHRIYIMDLA